MAYKIWYYGVSHIGRCRKVNQDNLICEKTILPCRHSGTGEILTGCVSPGAGIVFGVFDGMGGEEKGEIAAYIAADHLRTFSRWTKDGSDLIDFCCQANREICQYTKAHGLTSMGTTAVLLKLDTKGIWLCNIGDSKAFVMSGKKFEQISQDHVWMPELYKKPPLSQNLGIPEEELVIEPYTASLDYKDEDIYLLCSDGLSDMVDVRDMEEILADRAGPDAAQALLEAALEHGGKDNITFLLLYVVKAEKESFFRKILKRGSDRHLAGYTGNEV